MDEGKILKLKLAEIEKTREEIATTLGITRNTLYNYTKQSELDDDFKIQLFEKFGITIDKKQPASQVSLEKKIEKLEQEMSELKSQLLRLFSKGL